MLILKNVHKSFDSVSVLNGINLHLERGVVYTLRGDNGSGKTTLFNIISGFLRPTSGTICLKGKEIGNTSPYQINRLGIGRTFQDLRLATQMTVRENILAAMENGLFAFPSKTQKERVDKVLEQVALDGKADELAGEISYGQQKLLTLGCCIANNADLLLIDEPVAGIDKTNFFKIINVVMEMKKSGKTVFQIEHHPDYVRDTSDTVVIMERGRIVC
ncbi:MAG: ATP-binding cassette domain-containing protein [Planctomycetota bacterium]|jgi:branched-chain amino acid transport system ATP-binding protein|nr:ATP-binding cassette domain-containing protein [Planctomycetota bacterium]